LIAAIIDGLTTFATTITGWNAPGRLAKCPPWVYWLRANVAQVPLLLLLG
jgi:hypothetical protein